MIGNIGRVTVQLARVEQKSALPNEGRNLCAAITRPKRITRAELPGQPESLQPVLKARGHFKCVLQEAA